MGREQLAALARIIEEQLKGGTDSPLMGTWAINYDGERHRFYFEKCEFGSYCEERPTIIDVQGNVIDKGGPIFIEPSA